MDKQKKLDYKAAGLDLEVYEKSIEAIAPLVRRTHTPRVLDGFGGFASLVSLDSNTKLFANNYRHPVLVSSSDGVGTKLKVACMMNKHDTVGIDLVAMSVNDCLCTGGEPLFFLDYIAMPKDDTDLTRALVKGISDGCLEAECSLVGGETAILPDFYAPGDYDMAGFCVGVVERDHIIDGRHIRVGDEVIGLASTGLHSNGYSLARKVAFDRARLHIGDFVPELGTTIGAALLEQTRIYVRSVQSVLKNYPVKRRVVRGLAHITGEGLEGNIPRILPPGKRVVLRKESWPRLPIFSWLQRMGDIDEAEMFRVFNMGIGFVLIVSRYYSDSIIRQLEHEGVSAYLIGEVVEGEPVVELT
ncbi:MAG: phosphoribosylformylglycinamidine cyclo-ligase [Gemmataceae bacterium]